MTSRILILISILNIISASTHGQSRKQIGTSVWKVGNKIVSKSSIDHILEFDQRGKLKSEQKIFRDLQGISIDTVKAFYDQKGNLVEYHSTENRTINIAEYDSLKTQIKMTIMSLTDTVVQVSKPLYVELTDSTKRFKLDYDGIILYTYEKWTADGKPMLLDRKTEINGEIKSTETLKWRYEIYGNVTEFIKTFNDKVVKRTNHFYKDNFETKRIEQYFNPDYTIITTYKQEYKNE